MRSRYLQHAGCRLRDERGIRAEVLTHDGSVDDPLRRQATGGCCDRVADRDRPLRHRLVLNLVAASSLDRTGDPCAHPQVIVRGVGDSVDPERGYVTVNDFELHPPRVLNSCIPYSRGAHR